MKSVKVKKGIELGDWEKFGCYGVRSFEIEKIVFVRVGAGDGIFYIFGVE